MANLLKMAEQQAIVALIQRGWSQRRIARELGIHRETVGRYIRLARGHPAGDPAGPDSKPAKVITGSADGEATQPGDVAIVADDDSAVQPSIVTVAPDGEPAPKPAKVITGSPGTRSRCEPFERVILGKLEQGLSAQRIYQDLTGEHGFTDGYQSVQRFVRHLRSAAPLPFRRMECAPGAEAQVDFGSGAPVVIPDGQPLPVGVKTRRRRPHVFRIVLSHSRRAYSEVVWRQSTEEFIRCLENAFWHFGGVPKSLVIDNLKAAVTQADWYDPELNPKIVEFCRHYGTVILPTKPYTPRHKGKVEASVKYVQSNALKGRTFESLADQNRHLLDWESQTASTRIHGTTRQQVGKLFAEAERPALLPLPTIRFPSFQESQRIVNRDGHVEVAKAYYSLPPEYLGRKVWARWDSRLVWIIDDRMRLIHEHLRVEAGRFSTHPQHISSRKISGVERGTAWILQKISVIGPQAVRWAEALLAQRGVEGVRVLMGLINMTYRYESDRIEQACAVAHSHGAYRLRDVRALIERLGPRQERFEFAEEDPIIRPLAEYAELVHSAFQEEHR